MKALTHALWLMLPALFLFSRSIYAKSPPPLDHVIPSGEAGSPHPPLSPPTFAERLACLQDAITAGTGDRTIYQRRQTPWAPLVREEADNVTYTSVGGLLPGRYAFLLSGMYAFDLPSLPRKTHRARFLLILNDEQGHPVQGEAPFLLNYHDGRLSDANEQAFQEGPAGGALNEYSTLTALHVQAHRLPASQGESRFREFLRQRFDRNLVGSNLRFDNVEEAESYLDDPYERSSFGLDFDRDHGLPRVYRALQECRRFLPADLDAFWDRVFQRFPRGGRPPILAPLLPQPLQAGGSDTTPGALASHVANLSANSVRRYQIQFHGDMYIPPHASYICFRDGHKTLDCDEAARSGRPYCGVYVSNPSGTTLHIPPLTPPLVFHVRSSSQGELQYFNVMEDTSDLHLGLGLGSGSGNLAISCHTLADSFYDDLHAHPRFSAGQLVDVFDQAFGPIAHLVPESPPVTELRVSPPHQN